jgi:hypothetical protein
MRKFSKKQYLAAGAAAVLIAGGAGVAFAYWTTGGSGSGSGTVASSNGSLTLHATFDSAVLTPGGSVPVAYTADNGGSSNLYLSTLSVDSIATSDALCLPADFHATAIVAPAEVAAGAGDVSVGSGTLSMDDTDVSQDACKGATVTINLSST